MTNKDWRITDNVDLFTRFDADEWKNPTMSVEVVANLLASFYGFLSNADLVYINANFRGTEVREMEREISTRSSKANRNATESELMLEKWKELNFRRVKYIQDYLFDRYFDPKQTTSSPSMSQIIGEKINGMVNGHRSWRADGKKWDK